MFVQVLTNVKVSDSITTGANTEQMSDGVRRYDWANVDRVGDAPRVLLGSIEQVARGSYE